MAKASVEHRKRKIAEGAKQVSVVLDPEDAARLDRLNARNKATNKQTISAALAALEGANDINLPAALRRAAEELAEYQRQAGKAAAEQSARARFAKKGE